MLYTFNEIQTVEDCDTILTSFGKIKGNLLVRKSSIERQIENAEGQSAQLPTRKAYLETWIPSMTTLFNNLPEGKEKRRIEMTLNNADNELRALIEKIEKLNAEDYILREQKLEFTQEEITEVTAVIDGVSTRKTEIQASTPSAA
ncbi:MAG: hypothetical protein IPP69_11390 [Flavobacteriales bacterium]|nr:hypothetical protein [Flavobacteriales bacterium]